MCSADSKDNPLAVSILRISNLSNDAHWGTKPVVWQGGAEDCIGHTNMMKGLRSLMSMNVHRGNFTKSVCAYDPSARKLQHRVTYPHPAWHRCQKFDSKKQRRRAFNFNCGRKVAHQAWAPPMLFLQAVRRPWRWCAYLYICILHHVTGFGSSLVSPRLTTQALLSVEFFAHK